MTFEKLYSAPYSLDSSFEPFLSWNNHVQEARFTDFYTYVEIQANVSGIFSEAGITVWDAAKNIVAQKIETPEGGSKSFLKVWYNITEETGKVLQQDTTYTYQYHVKFNNQYYYSPEYTITTLTDHVHSHGDWVTTKEAGCETEGTKTKTCSCGNTISETIPATGHDYQEEYVIIGDCLNPDYHVITCTRCGDDDSKADEIVWSDWQETYPEGVADTWIEAKKQYRYSDLASSWSEPQQGTLEYVTSWPGGFDTSNGLYAQYNHTPVAAYEDENKIVQVLHVQEIGYLYWHWCRNSYTGGPIDRRINNSYSGTYPGFHAYFSTQTTNIMDAATMQAYQMPNASCCRDSYWYYRLPVYRQTYTVQTKISSEDTWNPWSEWSDEVYTESDSRQVESRTLYRYVTAGLGTHQYDDGVITIAPTIESTGIKTFTCSLCHDVYTEELPKIEHTHSFTQYISDNNATCVSDGTKTAMCDGCDKTDTIPDPGSALGHDFGEWTVETEADCEAEGLKRRDCTRCDEFETIPIAKLGHSFTGYVSNGDATCVSDGTKTAVCDRCDVQDTLPDIGSKLPHTYGDWTVTAESTCTTKGTERRECAACDASEEREFADFGPHAYGDPVVTEPTCTTGGYSTYTCTICGSSYIGDAVDPFGHTDEDGDNLCDACGATICEHAYDAQVTAPGCESQGYTTYTCANCGSSYVSDYTNALGHSYGNWSMTTAPSCEEAGTMTRVCSVCGMEETSVIDPTGHTEVLDEAKAPTCTEDGATAGSHCTSCGKVLTAPTMIPATGHSFGNWAMTKSATCQETGTMTRTCHCGAVETSEIPKLEHKPVVDTAVDVTCTESGLTEGSHCSLCNTVLTEQLIIPAKGHSWDDGVIALEPTEESTGIRKYTCTVCKETSEEIIPALDHVHKYDSVVTKPTCTEEGYTTHTCDCGDSYVDSKIPALGHDFVNGSCTRCGEADPNTPVSGAALTRIAGDGRCQTALEAADELKRILNVDKFQTIVVADGNNYPDALSGSYLAAVTDAPILLVQANQKKVTQTVIDYIVSNLTGDGTVYILGGPNSIPQDFEDYLSNAGFTVIRLAGNDRYATSLMIVQKAIEINGYPPAELLVCTGTGYADSLSASATGRPVLLVNGSKTSLTNSQKTFLRNEAGQPDIYVVGGSNSVSDAILAELGQYTYSGEAQRLAGNGREETSVEVAKAFFPNADFAVLANAGNYPDGLSGGPVAYAKHAPLLLVRDGKEAAAKSYVGTHIKTGYILGGVNSVSDKCVKNIFGADCLIK